MMETKLIRNIIQEVRDLKINKKLQKLNNLNKEEKKIKNK